MQANQSVLILFDYVLIIRTRLTNRSVKFINFKLHIELCKNDYYQNIYKYIYKNMYKDRKEGSRTVENHLHMD